MSDMSASSAFIASVKLPFSILYFSKLLSYDVFMLDAATRNPDINPIDKSMKRNIAIYLPISPKISLLILFLKGFFISHRLYQSRSCAGILVSLR